MPRKSLLHSFQTVTGNRKTNGSSAEYDSHETFPRTFHSAPDGTAGALYSEFIPPIRLCENPREGIVESKEDFFSRDFESRADSGDCGTDSDGGVVEEGKGGVVAAYC